MSVRGKTVAVVGGDRRMEAAVQQLADAGIYVRVTGLQWGRDTDQVRICPSPQAALTGADLLLLPVQGLVNQDRVFTLPEVAECRLEPVALAELRPGARVLVGLANEYLRAQTDERRLQMVEYREADEFATWNAIPSAEGAIQMAMEMTPFTLFGSRSLVLGYGRTGRALALLLKGLHSDVAVLARREVDMAKIWAGGYRYGGFDELPALLAQTDVVFNTVPAMVLPREVLAAAPAHAAIVDVASAPGGVDFEAARELGLTARLAPGLPGIVAPVTAGKFIANLVVRHLGQLAKEGA